MSSHYATAAVLSLAVGTAAFTLTKAKISAPLRVWIAGRKGRTWAWVFDLASCPYCLGHWLAFGAALLWRPWIITGWVVGQFAVTSLAMVAVAALAVLVIKKAVS